MKGWSELARRVRVPLGFVITVLSVWLAQPTLKSIAGGAAIAFLGLGIRAAASGHVRKNEQLTTTGPYAYTRNPLYLGSIIMAVGFGTAARSWWLAGALVLMFAVVYLPVIRSEEEYLRGRFAEFPEYEKNVPRLLPRLRPFGEGSGVFSWQLYRQHREYNALAGALALMVVLLAKCFWRGH